MKRIARMVLVCVALNVFLWAQGPPQSAGLGLTAAIVPAAVPVAANESAVEDFKTQMQKAVQDWKDAFNNNEMDKLAAMYTEDAALIDEDGVTAGRAALRDAFGKFKASGASMSSITVDRASASGNIGYLTDTWTESAPKSGGGSETVQGYSLVVMKRVGNKWLMAEHAAIAKPK